MKQATAFVLCQVTVLGTVVQSGTVLEAPADVIDSLVAVGNAHADKDEIAAQIARGAARVTLKPATAK